jgi:hypothetical protein
MQICCFYKPTNNFCSNPHGCGKYIQTTKLELEIADKFKELEFDPSFVEAIISKARAIIHERKKEYNGRRQSLINRKTALELRRDNAEMKYVDGHLEKDDYSRIRENVGKELESVNDQLAELECQQEVKADIVAEILHFTRDIRKAFDQASHFLKRQYLSFFWERFEVEDGIIVISRPTLLFRELQRLQQVYYRNQKTEKPVDNNGNHQVILSDVGLRG